MQTNTLIIGCGIAGAAAALRLSDDPAHHITIITRTPTADESNSAWAQGGIVTRGLDDSPELLVEDILRAGAGLSSRRAAEILATDGPRLVQEVLMDRCGVKLDRDERGSIEMGLEGAHSTRRVVHVGDKTGEAIMREMLTTLDSRPNVTLLTDHTAIDLMARKGMCYGVTILNRTTGETMPVFAAQTILATGGIGALYQHTTNPNGARGDGLAMAARVGARIANAEYVQFHPTAMQTDIPPNLLVSEAVRGEGAHLLNMKRERFMARYAPEWLELAPRDVVARAIHAEMQHAPYVLLDIASQRDAAFIQERFPQLVENAARVGVDITREPLPIAPAAHYFCGGVMVDEHGQTDINGLYAIGEVACTGLHGANRLASTSLLEGLVWGDRAARQILADERPIQRIPTPLMTVSHAASNTDEITQLMDAIRTLMWQHVGLIRTAEGLQHALQMFRSIQERVDCLWRTSQPTDALIGLRNAAHVAQIVAQAALANPHNIGAHYRADAVELAAVGD